MYLCQTCRKQVDQSPKLKQKNSWSRRIHFFVDGLVVVYRNEGGRAEAYCNEHLPADLLKARRRVMQREEKA